MSEKTEKIVYISTHGAENPEMATLPFVLANAALVMDVEAVVALQGPAVTLAKEGCLQHVFAAGLPPLGELVKEYLANGGKLMVCVPCIRERKIDEKDLIEGVELMAAAKLTQELLEANATLVY